MSIATDLAAILARGPKSATYTFGATTGAGNFVLEDVEMSDGAGGTMLIQSQVLRVPVAKLASAARGNTIVVGGTTFTIKDVRLTGGGEIREVFVA